MSNETDDALCFLIWTIVILLIFWSVVAFCYMPSKKEFQQQTQELP